MTRPLATALALALLAASGCTPYDVSATNGTSQDVRISIVKGRKQVHVSDIVLAPGASVSWSGKTNGSVYAHVTSEPAVGEPIAVHVPRRTPTEIEVSGAAGALTVHTNLPQPAPAADETYGGPDAQPQAETQPAAEPARDDAPPVDLIDNG